MAGLQSPPCLQLHPSTLHQCGWMREWRSRACGQCPQIIASATSNTAKGHPAPVVDCVDLRFRHPPPHGTPAFHERAKRWGSRRATLQACGFSLLRCGLCGFLARTRHSRRRRRRWPQPALRCARSASPWQWRSSGPGRRSTRSTPWPYPSSHPACPTSAS